MKSVLEYIVEMLFCSGVLLLLYRLLLEGRTSFLACRIYLLSATVIALLIPALDIPLYPGEVIYYTPAPVAAPAPLAPESATPVQQPFPWLQLFYAAGLLCSLLLMGRQLIHIARLHRGSRLLRLRHFSLAENAAVKSPFSFLRTIYVAQIPPLPERHYLLLHEASHIRHRHSVERLLMEGLRAVAWFNPFAWYTSRLLTEVQEYQADRDVIDSGCCPRDYAETIFRQLFGYSPDIANGLRDSLTKKRFKMMTRSKPSRRSLLQLAAALPVVAALMFLFSFTARATQYVASLPLAAETSALRTAEEAPPPPAAQAAAEPPHAARDNRAPATAPATTPAESQAPSQAQEPAILAPAQPEPEVEQQDTFRNRIEPSQQGDVTVVGFGQEKTDFSDSDPLYVVDGEVITSRKQIPDRIATITVLNSAQATQEWGEKGGNGVILITTKSDDGAGTPVSGRKKKGEGHTIGVHFSDESAAVTVFDTRFSDGMPVVEIEGEEVSPALLPLLTKQEANWYTGAKVMDYDQGIARYGRRAEAGVLQLSGVDRAALERAQKRLASAARESGPNETALPSQGKDADVFVVVEQMPTFRGGGIDEFIGFVRQSVRQPANGIGGRVSVRFIVEKSGRTSNVQILSSPHQSLSAEVVRVIEGQQWEPGRQRGKKARVLMTAVMDFVPATADESRQEEDFFNETALPSQGKDAEHVFVIVEQMPTFRGGGINEFRKYVQESVRYPSEAIDKQIAGKVVIEFIIDKQGRVGNVRAISSPHAALTQEVIRVVDGQQWEPGRQRGQKVNVRITLPVEFKIQRLAREAAPAPTQRK